MKDVQNENELFKQRIEHDHQNAQLRLEELRNIYKDNYDDYSYIWLLSTLNKVEKALSEAVDITNGWIPDDCDQTNIFDEQPESDSEPVEEEHEQSMEEALEELNAEPEELPEFNPELRKELDDLTALKDKVSQTKLAKDLNNPMKINISDIFKKRG